MHVLLLVAPYFKEYLPGLHPVHVSALDALVLVEYVPWRQSLHWISREAPTTSEYFPSPHGKQSSTTSAPGMSRNRPAGQRMHSPFLSERYLPSGHKYCVGCVEGCPVGCPVGVSKLQTDCPAREERPSGQSMQSPPL